MCLSAVEWDRIIERRRDNKRVFHSGYILDVQPLCSEHGCQPYYSRLLCFALLCLTTKLIKMLLRYNKIFYVLFILIAFCLAINNRFLCASLWQMYDLFFFSLFSYARKFKLSIKIVFCTNNEQKNLKYAFLSWNLQKNPRSLLEGNIPNHFRSFSINIIIF